MDISSIPQINSFTVTSLLITAILCVAAVFTVWYTCRTQIRLSQVIVGAFGYLAYYLLSSIVSSVVSANSSDLLTAIGYVAIDVICIELVRSVLIKYALIPRFQTADSAIGYALGFAGLYLIFSCALYYFSCYTTAYSYLSSGSELFAGLSESESTSAYELLNDIASRSGWSYLLTAVNRIFYLLRNVFVSILMWYSFTDEKKRFWLLLAPVLHIIAVLPEGLYNCGYLNNTMIRDIAVCVLSGIIMYFGAREYRAHESIVSHFKTERLRARRHR